MYPPARCLACDTEIDVGGERMIVTTALSGRNLAVAQPLRVASLHPKCWAQVHTALLRLRKEVVAV